MASNISYAGIDPDYPVAGQDNDSQGFRDNFGLIRTGLQTAQSEITTLQSDTAKLNEANDFGGNNITNANTLRGTETFYNGGVRAVNTNISFESGHYQSFSINADNLVFTFTDWPASGKYAKIRVAIFGNGITGLHYKWETENSGTIKVRSATVSGNPVWPNPDSHTITSSAHPQIYDFWTYDGGSVVYGEYIGDFNQDYSDL